ncbi:MAG: response regulator transcription factor [Candidatus Azobacteroides sp.]|nr:response regulator transcription factor [Candidatus Azobacteroides sp.]
MTDREKPVVLIVEDEVTLLSIIVDTLEYEGFATLKAVDGKEGLQLFFEKKPDLLVADVMMPKMDGFEMVKKIRQTDKTTPILFLTARSSIEDLVFGFELGANDYLRKPFKMQELIIRMRALLNRAMPGKTVENVFKIGNYTFDSVSQTLKIGNNTQELSYFENEILKRLCLNSNNNADIQSLLINLWHDDSPYNRNSLHGYIHKLRRLLRNDERVKIINMRGIGYKLVF